MGPLKSPSTIYICPNCNQIVERPDYLNALWGTSKKGYCEKVKEYVTLKKLGRL